LLTASQPGAGRTRWRDRAGAAHGERRRPRRIGDQLEMHRCQRPLSAAPIGLIDL